MILTLARKRAKTRGHVSAVLSQNELGHQADLVDDPSSSVPLGSKMINLG